VFTTCYLVTVRLLLLFERESGFWAAAQQRTSGSGFTIPAFSRHVKILRKKSQKEKNPFISLDISLVTDEQRWKHCYL
jgi:hypothetical protein